METMRVAEMTQAARGAIFWPVFDKHPNLLRLVPARMRAGFGLPPPP